MANKPHFNSGHIAMNSLKKNGVGHSASINGQKPYQIINDMEINELLSKMNEQSKDIAIPDFTDDCREEMQIYAIKISSFDY